MADNTSWSGKRRSFPKATRDLIMERAQWTCQIQGPSCRTKATQADHILNHARGGTDDPANGQAVCAPCHDAKTAHERARGIARRSRYRSPVQHPGLR